MIVDFLKRLLDDAPSATPELDARIALGALLVRVARSNGVYDPSEMASIDDILARRYGLTGTAAASLRADAESVEEEANDTVQFTRAIKKAVAFEDRDSVMEALWELVLADGDKDWEEEGFMRMVAPLLGINDRESALARQRVEARLTQS